MAYQEVTKTSYGSRLSSSFKKIGSGLALFLAATVLLFWNEGRAVKRAQTIKEAQGQAIHVEDVSEVKSDLDGRIIHASAEAISHDTLSDDLFGAKALGIKLIRKVEYYQWTEQSKEEKKEKLGGAEETITTYTYKKDWVSGPINSSEFHDPAYQNSNFVITQLEDEKKLAEDVTFGAYKLPDFLKSQVGGEKELKVSPDSTQMAALNEQVTNALKALGKLPAQAQTQVQQPVNQVNDSTVVNPNQAEQKFVHINNNVVYIGQSSGAPQIGDVRITFTYVPNGAVSLIAKVSGNTFEKYMADNGYEFTRLEMGTKGMDNMFQGAKNENSTMTWILRLVGLLLVIQGLKMTFEILSMLFKWLPALGSVVGMGIGLICSVIGFVWTLLIIAIAWLFYRPILAISLIVVAGAAFFFLYKRSKDKKKNAPAESDNNTTPPTPPASPASPATPAAPAAPAEPEA